MRTARFTRQMARLIGEGLEAGDIDAAIYVRLGDLADPTTSIVAADRRVDLNKCDTALPQDWFDKALSLSGQSPLGHIVWSYEYDTIFGSPQSLTPEGDLILALMDLGSPLTDEVHDDNRARLQNLIGNALRTLRQED